MNVEMVISQVNACVAALHDICDNNGGAYFKEFLKAVPDSVLEVEPGSGIGTFVHKNHEISISHAMQDAFVSDISRYMHALFVNFNERLFDLGTLEQFYFLLPSRLPQVSDPSFNAYGTEEIAQLVKHFHSHSTLSNEHALKHDWTFARYTLASRCRNMTLTEIVEFMHQNASEEIFPLVVSLYKYLLSVPMSSVDCERGFSVLNLCKSCEIGLPWIMCLV
jgi:hypothetical protein